MTVIAWDGRTLAADRQATNQGYARQATKIHRVPGGLVAFAGSAVHSMALLDWFKAERPPHSWPAPPNDNQEGDALFIGDDRTVLLYAGFSRHPESIEDPFVAMGCGRDYALAALHLGHDARRAVEVACALDIHCGMGIDVLTLSPDATTK